MENLDEYFKRYEISVLAFIAAAATTFVEFIDGDDAYLFGTH